LEVLLAIENEMARRSRDAELQTMFQELDSTMFWDRITGIPHLSMMGEYVGKASRIHSSCFAGFCCHLVLARPPIGFVGLPLMPDSYLSDQLQRN
jgi:hypothetical protein